MKHCVKCGIEKPLSSFPIRKDRRTVRPYCKCCARMAQQAWRRARPNYEKDRYQLTKIETRERHLVRKYGVRLADYERMLAAQAGRCAICHTTEDTQHNGVFHVDHCHATHRVRGLLCRGCNHMLGAVKDDPAALVRAIVYLGTPVPQIPEILGRAIMQAEGRMK